VTIRKRRDGWQIIVYAGLDPLTGKQRQLTRQVNGSRRQAEKVEARLRTEVADGRHAGTRVRTLGELLDLWIEWRAASDKPISPDTVEDYRSLIAKKIKPALGIKRGSLVPATRSSFTIGTGRSGVGTNTPASGSLGCAGCPARPRR
jgi:hypothetical protein